MTLLTLVENAVRHGIDPSEEGGRIDVDVWLRDGRCVIARDGHRRRAAEREPAGSAPGSRPCASGCSWPSAAMRSSR